MLAVLLGGCATTPKVNPGDIRCPQGQVVGKSSMAEMDETDRWTFEDAKKQCFMRYPENSPCLSRFIIKGYHNYQVKCGPALD